MAESKWIIVLYFVLVFLIGFLSAQVWDSYSAGITGLVVDKTPSDFVSERDILVYDDKIVIKVENASLSNYDSTGSMGAVLGEGVNGIRVRPMFADEISVGDIVTFTKGEELIVHRVVEKGIDSEGVYFITKGDSSDRADGKIRFENIEWKTIGLIY